MLWYSAAKIFSLFCIFLKGTTGLILIKLWFLFMLWHSTANCKVSKFSHFFAFFSGTTVCLILIKLWFLFMLWHSAASCNVSKFSHFFAFFLRNYWSDLDQTLIFVYAVALCSQLQSFQIFSLFCIFLRNCIFLVFIKLLFAFFSGTTGWSWSNFDFCSCCGTLQPIVKFQNFSLFCIFLRNYWSSSWSNFDFCSCCGTLPANCKVSKFSSLFAFFSGTTGLILIKSLIFVYAVALCSQL